MFNLIQTNEYRQWFARLLDEETKLRIKARLKRLTDGHFGDCRPVGDGVLELRLHFGPGYRVYFMRQGRIFIILLAGGDKSSQARDIDRAKRLAKGVWEDRSWEA